MEIFVELQFVGKHETRPPDDLAYLTFEGFKLGVPKYDLEFGWYPQPDTFDWYETGVVGATYTMPADFTARITFERETPNGGTEQADWIPKWTSIYVPDTFVIPPDLFVNAGTPQHLAGNYGLTTNGFGLFDASSFTPFSSSDANSFFSANFGGVAQQAFYALADQVGQHLGISGLGQALDRVTTVHDALNGVWNDAFNVMHYGLDNLTNPNFDPADYEAKVDAFLSNSIQNLVQAYYDVTGMGDQARLAFQTANLIVSLASNNQGGIDETTQYLINSSLFDGTIGTDVVLSSAPTGAEILGAGGNDILYGGPGNDVIEDGSGSDFINAGAGDDSVAIGMADASATSKVDFVEGGTGTDTVYVGVNPGLGQAVGTDVVDPAYLAGNIVADLSSGAVAANESAGAQIYRATVRHIENLASGPGDDHLTGSSGDNVLEGGAGNDWLEGGDGNDTLIGDWGSDRLSGGAGNDYISSGVYDGRGPHGRPPNYSGQLGALTNNKADRIDGGSGFDTLDFNRSGTAAAMALDLSQQANGSTITVSDGSTITGIEALNFYGGSAGDAIAGWSFADFFVGGAGDDQLHGGGGNDYLEGDAGNDLLDGGPGADSLAGGDGNDTYVVDDKGDTVDQVADVSMRLDPGFDTILASVSYSLEEDFFVEALTLTTAGSLYAIGNGSANTLTGNSAANFLNGLGGSDTLTGGEGADRLTGGAGADTFLDTRAGHNGDTVTDFTPGDKIIFSDASLATFTFSIVDHVLTYSGGSIRLNNVLPGTLVMTAATTGGVQLAFSNNAITTPAEPSHNDFDGNHRSDILWRDDGGTLFDWISDWNGGFASNAGYFATTIGTEWRLAATGDFNGDGRSDILWQQDVSGHLVDWLGDNHAGLNTNPTFDSSLPSNVHIVGSGDFNGDGRADLLLRQNGGLLFDWLGTPSGGFTPNTANFATVVGTEWEVVGTGDFNDDGYQDILWRQGVTGHLLDWLGNATGGFNTNSAHFDSSVPSDVQIACVGDFNGDGNSDILFRRADGLLFDWIGNSSGGFTSNTANFATVVSTEWRVTSVGDFNGDGIDDLLWRQDVTGRLLDWLGNSAGGFNTNPQYFDSSVPINVHIQDPFV